MTILTSWTSWLLNRPQMHEYNELHKNNRIPLSLKSISATSASFDHIRQAYLMRTGLIMVLSSADFEKKITCSPHYPSTFSPNIGTIPSTSAAANCPFQLYSHSSKRLHIGSVNSPCNFTFLLIVELILLCFLDHWSEFIEFTSAPLHAHNPVPREVYQRCCCHSCHHNLIVVHDYYSYEWWYWKRSDDGEEIFIIY